MSDWLHNLPVPFDRAGVASAKHAGRVDEAMRGARASTRRRRIRQRREPTACKPADPNEAARPVRARPAARRQGPFPLETRSRRSEEHTSELQSQSNLVCRLLLEKK